MIALIDCNNFYTSCEKVFDPALNGKPVIVLSNNDGCAIARSEEAKAIGIGMAQPAFMINDLIRRHDVRVFSSNYTLYGDMSQRIMQVIKEYVPRTEIYSIDELFADLSTIKYKDLTKLGTEIIEAVKACTGIPVSIGIAPTKTLAKMANRFIKKSKADIGVFCASDKKCIDEMLAFTPVGGIWGIGKQHEQLLIMNGFHTAADLIQAPEDWVRKNMSVKGLRLLHELKGTPCIKWEEGQPAKKNICTSRSFGQLISSKKEIKQAIAKFTSACSEKLRKEKSCAGKMNVFIQTNPHRPEDRQYFQSVTLEMHVATNHTTELMKYAMKGLELIFQPGYLYQKAGVIVMDLVPSKDIQMGLFDTENREKNLQLMQSIDKVNKAFGRDMVRFGVQDYGTRWKLKQENLSPCYTTRFDQLPKAKAI
jgi:DNA polymerase V